MERLKLSIAGREKVTLVLMGVILAALLVGLVKLQVADHAELAEQSENNRIRVVPIIPPRGLVSDREKRVIIDNRPSYTVSVVPAEEVAGVTVPRLSELIGLDTLEIRKRIRKNQVSRYQPAAVTRDIAFDVVAVLEEQNAKFPGVSYQMERVRQYTGELRAESYTGYVGEVSEDDLKRRAPIDYRLGCMIGKKGLERYYDYLLRGREGTEYIEVSASGLIIGTYEEKAPIPAVPGADLELTVDIDLQRACVNALDTFYCGAIIALDPRNGEILAVTSYPGYDANIFSSVIPADLWQQISSDSTHPLLNRPLNGLYPPGSTVKFVTVGAALEENLINRNTTLKPCYGGYRFGNRTFRCWRPEGHGALAAAASLEQSCDVFMYQLGLKLGIDELSSYYTRCGFARVTGVDLPGESPGLIPTTDYYDERYGVKKWTNGLVLNNSIGQGEILVTPLQLAQFYCGLANDGVVYRPHLIRKILKPDGEEVSVTPVVSFRLPFSVSTLEVLNEGLRLVVEGEHGTAKSLRNQRYRLGGKTGTAENPHGDNHAWFVGMAPLEEPEIVVCAIVENAGHGSDVAAPVVKQILDAYMDKKLAAEQVTMTGEGGGN